MSFSSLPRSNNPNPATASRPFDRRRELFCRHRVPCDGGRGRRWPGSAARTSSPSLVRLGPPRRRRAQLYGSHTEGAACAKHRRALADGRVNATRSSTECPCHLHRGGRPLRIARAVMHFTSAGAKPGSSTNALPAIACRSPASWRRLLRPAIARNSSPAPRTSRTGPGCAGPGPAPVSLAEPPASC